MWAMMQKFRSTAGSVLPGCGAGGFAPTNGVPAGARHVIVARGRDYGAVTPLKGVYSGGGSAGGVGGSRPAGPGAVGR